MLMSKANIKPINPKKHHYYPILANYIKGLIIYVSVILIKQMATHWAGDITHIKVYQGWRYMVDVLVNNHHGTCFCKSYLLLSNRFTMFYSLSRLGVLWN
jgi:hypothetical protein